MPKRPVIAAAAFGPTEELSTEQRRELRGGLSVLAARRLGPAALALNSILPADALGSADDVIFGSSMGSGRSLEAYLGSFPDPSPANFQNSVHAAVIETVMVLRRATVASLQSFADAPERLAQTVFRSACLSTATTTHLILAEEFSPWLSGERLGPRHTLVCWLQLGPSTTAKQPAGTPIGTLSSGRPAADREGITLETLVQSINDRQPLTFGGYDLQWL